jgi:hypothetical protein
MSSWYLDKGLETLRKQLVAKFPKITIYSIGDTSHQASKSDHNPDKDGSVDAIDVMIAGPFKAKDAEWLFDSIVKYRDKRVSYVIYNKRIVSSTNSPWQIRKYSGNDPHTNHVHLSVTDKNRSAAPWQLIGDTAKPTPKPQPKPEVDEVTPADIEKITDAFTKVYQDNWWGAYHAAKDDEAYKKATPAQQKGWRQTRDIVRGVVGGPVSESVVLAAIKDVRTALDANNVSGAVRKLQVLESELESDLAEPES